MAGGVGWELHLGCEDNFFVLFIAIIIEINF